MSDFFKRAFRWPTNRPNELACMVRTYGDRYTVVLFTTGQHSLDPDNWHVASAAVFNYGQCLDLTDGKDPIMYAASIPEFEAQDISTFQSVMDFYGYMRSIPMSLVRELITKLDRKFGHVVEDDGRPKVCELCGCPDKFAGPSPKQKNRIVCYKCFVP